MQPINMIILLSHRHRYYPVSCAWIPIVAALAWLLLPCALSLSLAYPLGVLRPRAPLLILGMVRNIDFPEALIFHETLKVGDSSHSIILEEDGITLKAGLLGILQECRDVGTPAILIASNDPPSLVKDYLQVFAATTDDDMTPARALWETIHAITIQPAGFGGSSGFGRKMADPERSPLPKHTVVFCADLDVCRAARAVGMRVLCLQDNDLADAIIDDYYNLYLEDVATPGSFWLNPPYARDDEGNKVDAELFITRQTDEDISYDGELSAGYLQAILDDMDPL
jgi:hypothetical protein